MKNLTKLWFFVLLAFALNSCAASEKSWHKNARMIGVKSVFIHKDGTRNTGEEWYKDHPEEDRKFKEKYGENSIKKSVNPSQVFVGME